MTHTLEFLKVIAACALFMAWVFLHLFVWDWLTGGSLWSLPGSMVTSFVGPVLGFTVLKDMRENAG